MDNASQIVKKLLRKLIRRNGNTGMFKLSNAIKNHNVRSFNIPRDADRCTCFKEM